VFCSFILLYGCTQDRISIEQANLITGNSLIYQVDVKLKKAGDLFIEYFAVGDSNRLYTSLSENTDHVVFDLIGLKPETNYQYVVYARINGGKIFSKNGQFHSGALPDGLPGLTLTKNSYSFEGYILLKTFFDPGALLMIDNNADVVWYHIYDQTTVRAFNFSPDYINCKVRIFTRRLIPIDYIAPLFCKRSSIKTTFPVLIDSSAATPMTRAAIRK